MAPNSGYALALPGTKAARYNRCVMGIFFRKFKSGYESDVTKLVRTLLEERPDIVADQRIGRALFWDKKLDLEALRRWRVSRIRQKAYVYQTDDKA